MKNTLSRFALPSLAALTIAAAGAAFAQSGTAPSGTPAPARQPGSDSKPSGQARAAEAPKVIAINFYADWCAGCKALKPKLEEAMSVAEGQPCLTVKLDQTDKDSKQSQYMLAALGLGDLWKEHAGKTGFVLLVDANTKKVVNTITYKQDVKEIKSALAAALKG
jgi:thiol-disulfide isomerase/thioredoxin